MVYDSFVTGRLGRPFQNDGLDPMLRWFRYFLPKEERFFDLFARHSQTVVQGALALQDMLRGGDETPVFCQRVNQFENDADNITREVLTAVRHSSCRSAEPGSRFQCHRYRDPGSAAHRSARATRCAASGER